MGRDACRRVPGLHTESACRIAPGRTFRCDYSVVIHLLPSPARSAISATIYYPLMASDQSTSVSQLPLNKICEIEDWQGSEIASVGPVHRKHWERAQLMRALQASGRMRPDAWVLSVGAGHEPPIYQLTNHVRWVFATDMYETSGFGEAEGTMLQNPDQFAGGIIYNPRRLVVQYMDARDLRYEDATFDIVFSLSSIEHFGGVDGGRKAMEEISRVLKPGGIVMLATEMLVDGSSHTSFPGLELFSPQSFLEMVNVPGVSLWEPLSTACSPATLATVRSLDDLLAEAKRYEWKYPHIVIEHQGKAWTSVSCVLLRDQQT